MARKVKSIATPRKVKETATPRNGKGVSTARKANIQRITKDEFNSNGNSATRVGAAIGAAIGNPIKAMRKANPIKAIRNASKSAVAGATAAGAKVKKKSRLKKKQY